MAGGLAKVFEERHGALVRKKYGKFRTARSLKMALRRRIPSIIVTDGVLKVWLRKYGMSKRVISRGRGSKALARLQKIERKYGRALLSSQIPRQQCIADILEQVDGGGLRYMPRPPVDDTPAWASMVRRRVVFLELCIQACQQEKTVLLDKLHEVS